MVGNVTDFRAVVREHRGTNGTSVVGVISSAALKGLIGKKVAVAVTKVRG